MHIEIRPISVDEFDGFARAMHVAFGAYPDPKHVEADRRVFEPDRSLVAFDGPDIVGGTAVASFELTVPGAILPAAGVTSAGVVPTHRRRGILTSLMRRQLEGLHEGGEPLAALWASEASIYGRFGYGVGTLSCRFEIQREMTAFVRPDHDAGRVRLVDRKEALGAFRAVYDGVRAGRPGMLARNEVWWGLYLDDPGHDPDGGPYFFVTHESSSGADGYALYRVKRDWGEGTPRHLLEVEELVAATSAAYAALWRYCFDVDLVGRIRGWGRPVDEPLVWMLADPRRLNLTVMDGMWLRLVDVPVALAGRRYAGEGQVSLEVRDGFCPWNEGRYRLVGGPEGAECERTGEEADIALGAADLAAAYLGGVRFQTLARAGRVVERKEGALRVADAMFMWDPPPWCPREF